MRTFFSTLCLLASVTFLTVPAQAQCVDPPTQLPSTSCSGVQSGTQLASSSTTIASSYYFPSSGSSTYNNVTIGNGGTLRICGALTLNSLTLNAGSKIIVESGGSLTIGSVNLNGGNITNYGQLTFSSDVTISSDIYSAAGSSLTFAGNTTQVNSNGRIFVGGTASAKAIRFDHQLCMGSGASFAANSFFTNIQNTIGVSSGTACFRINANGSIASPNQNTVSGTSALKLCLGTGTSFPNGTPNYGSATVTSNCASCQVALPVELAYWSARQREQRVDVSWVTASERNSAYFTVERAADGLHFVPLTEHLMAKGTTALRTEYVWSDSAPITGINYYRLLQVDLDGTTAYSKINSVLFRPDRTTVTLAPNPANGVFRVLISSSTTQPIQLDVTTPTGQKIIQRTVEGESRTEQVLDLSAQPAGIYLLRVNSQTEGETLRLVNYK